MSSPLHVLTVGVTEDERARLLGSLEASDFAADVRAATDVAHALASLDGEVEVVVLGHGVGEADARRLSAHVRATRPGTQVVPLDELLTDARADETARLSRLFTRHSKSLTHRGGNGWVAPLLDLGPAEVYAVDAQTLRVRFVNERAARNARCPREALRGRPLWELLADQDEGRLRSTFEPLITGEREVLELALERRRPDGSAYPLQAAVRRVLHGREAVLFVVGQDLTEVRGLEAERDRYRFVFEACGDAALLVDASGRLVGANGAAARLYSRTREELIGLGLADLRAPGAPSTPAGGRALHRAADGRLFEAEVTQRAGAVAGARLDVLLVRDATATAALQEALADANDTARALIDACPEPAALVDPQGRVTHWSRSAERVFGWSPAEVLGCPLPGIPPDREAEWQTLLRLVQEGNTLAPLRVVRRRRDDSRVDVLLGLAPLHGRRALVVLADVTASTRLDIERAHLVGLLDRMRDEAYLVDAGSLAVRFANERAARAFAGPPDALTDQTLLDLAPGLTLDAFGAHAGAALLPGSPPSRWSATLRDVTGALREREVEVTTLDALGARVHAVVAREPDALEAAPLPRVSAVDGTFVAALALELDEAWELDLAGPAARRELHARASAALGARGRLAVTDGGELVALLEGPVATAGERAARMIEALEDRPLGLGDGLERAVRITAGLAVARADARALALSAAAALAQARRDGPGGFARTDEVVADDARQRLAIHQALRRALERDLVRVAWCPQVNLATDELVALVAAPTWRSAAGDISGAALLDLAATCPPSMWLRALERAAAPIVARGAARVVLPVPRVRPAELDALAALRPGAVGLQVPAGRLTGEDARGLRARGVGLTLEVGWTIDARHLDAVQPDALALPREVVEAAPGDAAAQAVVEALIAAGRRLGLPVVADVRGPDDAARLRAAGAVEGRTAPLDLARALALAAPRGP